MTDKPITCMETEAFSFNLNDGEKIEAIPVKREPDGTVFITVDCLKKHYPMQQAGEYSDGYEHSDLRKALNGEILDRFPKELRERMIPFENGDMLRIPTEREIFGRNHWGKEEPESVEQFEAMKLRRNRIALQGYNGAADWYWLQNQYVYSPAQAVHVNITGEVCYSNTWYTTGVRPLFKIKNAQ